jgi:hypothetical protein
VRAIASIEADLIGLLMKDHALGEAAEQCAADDPGFDLAAALGILVAGQIVSAIGKDYLT